MLAWYYFLPTIGRLSLCTVVWRIYVTRLFGVIFRLFQYYPYNYQTNGARVRATGIVGILTLWSEKQSTLPLKIDRMKVLTIEMNFEYTGVDGAKCLDWYRGSIIKSRNEKKSV